MKKISIILGAFLLAVSITSCNKDKDEKKALTVPSTYDGTNFTANTTEQEALVVQLIALTDEAKKGRNDANTVTKSALEDLFTAGTPSLSSQITTYFKNKLEGTGGWFDELAKASGNTWEPKAPENGVEGGVFGGRLFDENGLEYEELIGKVQLNATLYNHAIGLMKSEISIETVDKLIALFGAKPAFANSGSTNVAEDVRDRVLANYGSRRDKNDGNGMYSRIKKAFITLQAAIKAGDEYEAEQNKALEDIQILWEKINAATVINYCHSSISSLSGSTEVQIGSALHAINEGIGFIYGFKTIDQNYRRITDAQIDEVLAFFNVPVNGTATVYKFATDPSTELTKLQQAIDKLKDIYSFSNQEIEDFKTNWVSSQSR